MKKTSYLLLMALCLLMASCASQKKLQPQDSSKDSIPENPLSVSAWHTSLMQGVHITVQHEKDQLGTSATMQVVRDSMLVISITPALGLEMARLEATPTEIIGIDKMHNRFIITSYEELNKHLVPALSWETLQQICTGELPTGEEEARLVYSIGEEQISITIQYPARKTDVPVKVTHLRIDKYKQIDITQWL